MCELGGVGDENVHQEGMLLKLVFVPERIDLRLVPGPQSFGVHICKLGIRTCILWGRCAILS